MANQLATSRQTVYAAWVVVIDVKDQKDSAMRSRKILLLLIDKMWIVATGQGAT